MGVAPDSTINYDKFVESFQKSDTEASRKWLESLLKKDGLRDKEDFKPEKSPTLSYDESEKRLSEIILARFYKLTKVRLLLINSNLFDPCTCAAYLIMWITLTVRPKTLSHF